MWLYVSGKLEAVRIVTSIMSSSAFHEGDNNNHRCDVENAPKRQTISVIGAYEQSVRHYSENASRVHIFDGHELHANVRALFPSTC